MTDAAMEELNSSLSEMEIDSQPDSANVDNLATLLARMKIEEVQYDKPNTWFWYKGRPIRSKEDFKFLVVQEMKYPY